jgi:hypothetical protein
VFDLLLLPQAETTSTAASGTPNHATSRRRVPVKADPVRLDMS